MDTKNLDVPCFQERSVGFGEPDLGSDKTERENLSYTWQLKDLPLKAQDIISRNLEEARDKQGQAERIISPYFSKIEAAAEKYVAAKSIQNVGDATTAGNGSLDRLQDESPNSAVYLSELFNQWKNDGFLMHSAIEQLPAKMVVSVVAELSEEEQKMLAPLKPIQKLITQITGPKLIKDPKLIEKILIGSLKYTNQQLDSDSRIARNSSNEVIDAFRGSSNHFKPIQAETAEGGSARLELASQRKRDLLTRVGDITKRLKVLLAGNLKVWIQEKDPHLLKTLIKLQAEVERIPQTLDFCEDHNWRVYGDGLVKRMIEETRSFFGGFQAAIDMKNGDFAGLEGDGWLTAEVIDQARISRQATVPLRARWEAIKQGQLKIGSFEFDHLINLPAPEDLEIRRLEQVKRNGLLSKTKMLAFHEVEPHMLDHVLADMAILSVAEQQRRKGRSNVTMRGGKSDTMVANEAHLICLSEGAPVDYSYRYYPEQQGKRPVFMFSRRYMRQNYGYLFHEDAIQIYPPNHDANLIDEKVMDPQQPGAVIDLTEVPFMIGLRGSSEENNRLLVGIRNQLASRQMSSQDIDNWINDHIVDLTSFGLPVKNPVYADDHKTTVFYDVNEGDSDPIHSQGMFAKYAGDVSGTAASPAAQIFWEKQGKNIEEKSLLELPTGGKGTTAWSIQALVRLQPIVVET